jgi:hypothetical protein
VTDVDETVSYNNKQQGTTAMSLKASIVRAAIRLTPTSLVVWVGNIVMKGIGKMMAFHFDLDQRRVYVCTLLQGEVEPIEVWLEDFAIRQEGENYCVILRQARSNKIWLTNLLAKVTGKAWKIPPVPQLRQHMGLVTELLGERA